MIYKNIFNSDKMPKTIIKINTAYLFAYELMVLAPRQRKLN